MKTHIRAAGLLLGAATLLSASSARATQAVEGYLTTPDGVRLFYRAIGDGDPVVVLPGGMYLFEDFKRLAAGRKLIAYDQRNRGRSQIVQERAKLERGVVQDADDFEAVRQHFDAERFAIIAHSYMGLAAALYASGHPHRVSRIVQIGPPPPVHDQRYQPDPNSPDPVVRDVFAKLGALQMQGRSMGPAERCTRAWEILRPLYVARPEDSNKLSAWGGCDLPNEQNAMQHYNAYIAPSMKALAFTPEQLANIDMPVLTIHGKMDRNAPYGGGRDWASRLPHARLLTIADAAHAPWVEAPETVFDAIERFLQGEWPESARTPAALKQESGQARSGESARCSRAASTPETACAGTPDSR